MTQLKRFQQALKKGDADAALVSSEINQRYLSDFDYSDGYIVISPTEAYLFTDSRYIEAARASVTDFEIIKPDGGMLDAVASLFADKGYKKVIFEESSLSVASLESFKAKIKNGCQLCSGASKILFEQRKIKLDYEIERIEKAQELTDMAFEHILSFISLERTEKDVALELEFFMRSHGAEATAFDTIAVSGSASSLPHGVPSDVKLRRGFLTMDFGAKYKGYCSDMTRTVVIGKVDTEMKTVYETVLKAQKTALDGMHSGMLCSAADALARDVIEKAGFGAAFGHSLGHGVGTYIHEGPSLSPKAASDSLLQCGNVVTVEPGIYLEGRFGCRIEDMVLINADGSIHNFTKSPKELIEF